MFRGAIPTHRTVAAAKMTHIAKSGSLNHELRTKSTFKIMTGALSTPWRTVLRLPFIDIS
jgi:hypothetical protein